VAFGDIVDLEVGGVELGERLGAALEPLGLSPGDVRVRTFHALGLEILRDAGAAVEPLLDRMAVLRQVAPEAGPAGWRRLDTAFSRLKLDLGITAAEVAADPEPGPIARTFLAYEAAIDDEGGLDFDDLVARSLRLLERDARVLARWRERCGHLLVDESQDLDRAQLRLALLLAAPANRIFLVGDDDQSIYGWRLADVRRVLALAEALPGLRRVDLEMNYRCPATVIRRAVRLVEHNRERFAKSIWAGPAARGRLVLAAVSAAALLHESNRVADRLFVGDLVRAERHVADHQRVAHGARHRSRHEQHLVHGHRHGRVVSLDDHAERIANQHDVSAGRIHQRSEAGVVGREARDLLAGGTHLRQGIKRYRRMVRVTLLELRIHGRRE